MKIIAKSMKLKKRKLGKINGKHIKNSKIDTSFARLTRIKRQVTHNQCQE